MTKTAFILGMHRSGTSLLANLIGKFGFHVSNDLQGDEFNEDGYYENAQILDINDIILLEMGSFWSSPYFLPKWKNTKNILKLKQTARRIITNFDNHGDWVVKDPRFSITFPFWKDLVDGQTKALICIRNPLSVALSLNYRDGFDIQKGLKLWRDYTIRAIVNTLSVKRIVIPYEDLFSDDINLLRSLSQFLDYSVDRQDWHSTIRGGLKHYEFSMNDLMVNETIPLDIKLLYKGLVIGRDDPPFLDSLSLALKQTIVERPMDPLRRIKNKAVLNVITMTMKVLPDKFKEYIMDRRTNSRDSGRLSDDEVSTLYGKSRQ